MESSFSCKIFVKKKISLEGFRFEKFTELSGVIVKYSQEPLLLGK